MSGSPREFTPTPPAADMPSAADRSPSGKIDSRTTGGVEWAHKANGNRRLRTGSDGPERQTTTLTGITEIPSSTTCFRLQANEPSRLDAARAGSLGISWRGAITLRPWTRH